MKKKSFLGCTLPRNIFCNSDSPLLKRHSNVVVTSKAMKSFHCRLWCYILYVSPNQFLSAQAAGLHSIVLLTETQTLLFERNKHIEASTLLGTAFRIAQRIGLQRDGAHFALSPWRVEMRRRIWLYLCVLDVRAMETLGAEPLMGELESDTRMIRNCNDLSWDACEFSKLWPNPSDGFTEMTYSLVEAELSSLLRVVLFRAGKALLTLDSYTKVLNQLIEQVRERIDVLYLKNLDMAEPLQRLISAMASACISKAELITQQYIYRCRKITGAVVNEQRDRYIPDFNCHPIRR